MDVQKQQAAILELGSKLIEDFDSRDITAKWMASYLSELMIAAEDDPTRQSECKDMILELWRERNSFPGGDPLGRYSETLSVLEAHLKTGQPLFEVWLPTNNRDPRENSWAVLARRIRRHGDFLASSAVIQSSESEGLINDEMLDIAHLADPDAQSQVLDILRVLIREHDGKKNETDDHTLLTLKKLREALDDFEACYLAANPKPEAIN